MQVVRDAASIAAPTCRYTPPGPPAAAAPPVLIDAPVGDVVEDVAGMLTEGNVAVPIFCTVWKLISAS